MSDDIGVRQASTALRVMAKLGVWKSVALITVASVLGSLLVTRAVFWIFSYGDEFMVEAMSTAIIVPAFVAPVASYWAVKLAVELIQTRETLIELASRDEVTRLYNRRYLMAQLAQMSDVTRRSRGTLGILLIDVDRLKHLNDDFGHHAGDLALAKVADAIRESIRREDFAARYAGDEFVVLLPEANERVASEAAARIHMALAAPTDNTAPRQSHPQLSVSIGIAISSGGEATQSLLRRVDVALYQAKNRGRGISAFAANE